MSNKVKTNTKRSGQESRQTTCYVIAYDIPDDRRRTKIHQILMGFGKWTQYSLYMKRSLKVGEDVRILLDHAEPQIGSRRGREHPRSFQFQLLIGSRLEKAQTFPKEDRDDAHMDFVNQPGS
jgi:hypothetical protein